MIRFSKILGLLLVFLPLVSPAFAQPKILYIGASAVLPGSGEILLGQNTRGTILIASDILALSAYLKTGKDITLQQSEFINYAHRYAGVSLDSNLKHYQVVQDYFSSDDFNKFQEMMARNYFVIYLNNTQAFVDYMAANTYTGDESWEWHSDMHWKKYRDIRRNHQRTKMNHNLALGVMLLNRAISVVDTAILSRSNKANHTLYLSPSNNDGVTMNYQVKF